MTTESQTETLIKELITRFTTECETLEREIQSESQKGLEDWLLVEACKDYDTIELENDCRVTSPARDRAGPRRRKTPQEI